MLDGIPLTNDFRWVTQEQMLAAIEIGLKAAKSQCSKIVCDNEVCDRISVHIKCDADMKEVLGKENTKKYCDRDFVFDCKKDKWEKD